MRRLLLALAFATAVLTIPADAFVPYSIEWNGGMHHPHWDMVEPELHFVQNDSPLEMLTNVASGARIDPAIEGAMRAWTFEKFRIRLDGKTSATDGGEDKINLITFANTVKNRDLVKDAYAVTPTFWRVAGNKLFLGETDVVFTTKLALHTDDVATPGDIQEICTHEFGHAFGLLHSPVVASIMYAGTGPYNPVSVRGIAPDDILGVRWLYRSGPQTGQGDITGRVLLPDGRPVLGAHLSAISQSGVVQVGALSDRLGNFVLPGLPPDQYQVAVEPLDGHCKPADTFSQYHRGANTSFVGTFAGGNRSPTRVEILPGRDATPLAIQVADKKATRQVNWLLWWDGKRWQNKRAQLLPGTQATFVAYGPTFDTIPISSFRFSGAQVSINYDGVRQFKGDQQFGPYVMLPVTAGAGAQVGPRSFLVDAGDELAVMTGAIEVVK
jgi:hypothetical protein